LSNEVIPSIVKNAEDCEWTYFEGQEGRLDRLRWKILIGDDQSETKSLTYGIMELPEGRFLDAHFHADHEVYHVLEGVGVVLIDDEVTGIGPGSVVYIPGNATHGIRNTGKERLVMIWIFPNDKWNEVEYHMVDRSF
jgi:mannose-6-phosphate isomerase-like protein (cupin superfamily)